MSKKQESAISISLKFTGSTLNYYDFKKSESYLAKIALATQFNLIGLSCFDKYYLKLFVNSTQHFPYFLAYHYSPVDLQKKHQYPSIFF